MNTIDVNPGAGDSYAGWNGGFTAVGDNLYFSAHDAANGLELRWVDTSAATLTVNTVDLNPGASYSYAGQYGGFAAVGDKLFFSASDTVSGNELRWIDTTLGIADREHDRYQSRAEPWPRLPG